MITFLLLSAAVLKLSATGFVAAEAQETKVNREIPSAASVTAGEFERLIPGQKFGFRLQFNQAPDLYGKGGVIKYTFQNTAYEAEAASRARFPNFSGLTVSGETPIKNGESDYSLSLTVLNSMGKGTWKLTSVTIGEAIQKSVPFRGNVTFDIVSPQPLRINLKAPSDVEAGRDFRLNVTFLEIPHITDSCVLGISSSVRAIDNQEQLRSSVFSAQIDPIRITPDKLSYDLTVRFPPDLPASKWRADASVLSLSGNYIDCAVPGLSGDTSATFDVRSAVGLVTPTAASVTVNPSQIELLRGEANQLNAKARSLHATLKTSDVAANKVLIDSLQNLLTALDRTELSYKQRGSQGSSIREVDSFFNDIRLSYREALQSLRTNGAQVSPSNPQFLSAKLAVDRSQHKLNSALVAGIATIVHNANAFDIVASTRSVTFDLSVFSVPNGAIISWRLRGGEYQKSDHETDWQIKNLPRAVYSIRVQKNGYEDNEVPFDAIDNTNTSVSIPLKRKLGAR